MTTAIIPPRERILDAALSLLEAGGLSAVSTRAVSSAAGVQAPTLYRQFGDMQGLLDAVALRGFTAYLERKQQRDAGPDPVEELRRGWDQHVAFGLEHPHLYRLMSSAPRTDASGAAEREMNRLLRVILLRVAADGRLTLPVERAAELMHAACLGVTLSLIAAGADADPALSELTRETVLRTLLTAGSGPGAGEAAGEPAGAQVTRHAVALGALLPTLDTPLSGNERALLLEWLRRLGGVA